MKNFYFNATDISILEIKNNGVVYTLSIIVNNFNGNIKVEFKDLLDFSKINDSIILASGIYCKGDMKSLKDDWKTVVANYLFENGPIKTCYRVPQTIY